MYFKSIVVVAMALCLCGCAARSFTSIPMVQSGDDGLTCAQIGKQIADNAAAEGDFQKKDRDVANANIAKGIGGAAPFVGPLIMASADLSNEEQVKARALADRNEHLEYLKKQKGCTE
ncbi:MAG TPA: hypothetical protein VGH02_10085 [Rhizomicrobium sp.]